MIERAAIGSPLPKEAMYYEELVQVTQTVWESMLDLELVPADDERPPTSKELIARIEISGAWQGSIVASCSEAMARKLAGALLLSAPDQVLPQHVYDALAEITNMLGGSIKALFPGPCKLSLPSVFASGSAPQDAASERLERVCFDCRGDTFNVELRRSAAI